jgi:hypothetical protein
MNDLARWHEANARHLAAALAWLRLRLARHSASFAPGPSAEKTAPPTEADLARAAADRNAAEAVEPPPALVLLARRFGLSRFEQDTLLLCAALELDTRTAALCARAQDDPTRPYPTFALALGLFDEPAWDVLSPERPLRYWRLLEVHQSGPQPLTASPLHADERLVNYLRGLNYLDDRLTPLLLPVDVPEGAGELTPSQQATVARIVRPLEQATPGQRLPVLHLLGPDVAGKRDLAWHAAAALGLHLYRLPAELLPGQAGELDTLARLWQRECLLLPIALYLDAHAADRATPDGPAAVVERFLARTGGVVFLDTADAWPDFDRPVLPVEVARPTVREQQEAWAAALGPEAGACPGLLAGQFNLGLAAIRQIAAGARAQPDNRPLAEQLWGACLQRTRPRLDALAQRLDPQATWDDLVLPAPELETLRQVAVQVRQRSTVYETWGFGRKTSRGLGIAALFAGESGTGKTLAAEVLAHELRLHLYRIDLSAVVSKYIGETEKNLRRLFDAAEDGGAVLFFDEADALFGKRSEVKDSHDRYANIEINYLLQRLEAYRGLAVLATNLKSALDPAFLRRLRFLVTFPFPGAAERQAIWQRAFPAEAPTEGLDWERLARLTLTGGSIHNIALHAAFLAAEAGSPVTLPLVLDAARAELRKLERPVNEADFRL